MSTNNNNVFNQVAFLRTTREYPEELHALALELNKTYLDVAAAVNNRTIGMFTINRPTITGESYFFNGNQRQQALREVFSFTSTAAIPHNITVTNTNQFIHCYGSYTDGNNTYGLIYGTNAIIAGQIVFYITPTQIVFASSGMAPALTSGQIVLEWYAQP